VKRRVALFTVASRCIEQQTMQSVKRYRFFTLKPNSCDKISGAYFLQIPAVRKFARA